MSRLVGGWVGRWVVVISMGGEVGYIVWVGKLGSVWVDRLKESILVGRLKHR